MPLIAAGSGTRRAAIAFACLTVVGVLLSIGPSHQARAAEIDASCVGTQHAHISPGLTFQPRDVTVTVKTIYSPCASPTTPTVASATQNSSFVVTSASCLNPFDPGSGTKVLTWNTGATSVFSFNRIGNNVGGSTVVTETGLITAGLFAGDNAIEQITGPVVNTLDCLSEKGVTDRFATLQLVIARP
jgi:hypothetical protein